MNNCRTFLLGSRKLYAGFAISSQTRYTVRHMTEHHSHRTPGFLRSALRTLRDPSIIDGAGPESRRRFARQQDGRAARNLLDIIMMQSQR